MKNVMSAVLGNTAKLVLAVVLSLTVVAVYAQDTKEKPKSKYANAETKKTKALGAEFGKKLKPINELLSAEDWKGSMDGLNKLDRPDKWKSHEYAHLYNTRGYVYYQLENLDKALGDYLKVTKEPDVPPGVFQNTLKTIAQLYLSKDDCRNAIKYFKQWMDTQEIIGSQIYAILSQCYYNLEDLNNSLKNIEIAIGMEEGKGVIAKENWYSIQRAIYYQRKDFKKVIQILEKLIVNYPKVNYWLELGGMYSELEDDDKRHAAYDVVNLMNGLDSESRLMSLAYMYLSADAPYQAGKIIADGMKKGIIDKTEKNLQVVGSAFYQSRNPELALPFMEEAAGKAEDGESYARLAGIYGDLARDDDAIRAGLEASKRGGVKRPDLLAFTVGGSYFNQRKYDKALKIFGDIKSDDKRTVRTKNRWLKHIRQEKKRDKQLRASGIDLDKIYNQS